MLDELLYSELLESDCFVCTMNVFGHINTPQDATLSSRCCFYNTVFRPFILKVTLNPLFYPLRETQTFYISITTSVIQLLQPLAT